LFLFKIFWHVFVAGIISMIVSLKAFTNNLNRVLIFPVQIMHHIFCTDYKLVVGITRQRLW